MHIPSYTSNIKKEPMSDTRPPCHCRSSVKIRGVSRIKRLGSDCNEMNHPPSGHYYVIRRKNSELFSRRVWFFFFLFNSMSNFLDYLMPKPYFKKNRSGTILPIATRIRGSCLSQECLSESERNSATGVRTCLLRFRRPVL